MEESFFIQQINLIADANNCKVTAIDFNEKILNIEGSDENELKCSIAIGDFMHNCDDVVQDKKEGIEMLTKKVGWLV